MRQDLTLVGGPNRSGRPHRKAGRWGPEYALVRLDALAAVMSRLMIAAAIAAVVAQESNTASGPDNNAFVPDNPTESVRGGEGRRQAGTAAFASSWARHRTGPQPAATVPFGVVGSGIAA